MMNNFRLRWLTGSAAMLFCCVAEGQGALPCDGAVGAGPASATPAACAKPAPCPTPPPRHVYVCPCPTCQERGGEPERAPGQPELGPGAYVAPPQTGVQVEGSRQVSVGGLAIRFPEFRLELPTIELPHRSARTRGAHMELDRAIADFRSLPAQPTAQYAYAAARQETYSGQPQAGRPDPETARPESDEDIDEMRKRCECMAEQLRAKEALLNSKLIELEHQLRRLQSVPTAAPCPTPQPQCAVPQRPLPPPTGKQAMPPANSIEALPLPSPESGTGLYPENLPLEYLQPPHPLVGQTRTPAAQVAPVTYHGSLPPAAAPAAKRPTRLPRP